MFSARIMIMKSYDIPKVKYGLMGIMYYNTGIIHQLHRHSQYKGPAVFVMSSLQLVEYSEYSDKTKSDRKSRESMILK